MKLIDLLAKNLTEWPQACTTVVQGGTGQLYGANIDTMFKTLCYVRGSWVMRAVDGVETPISRLSERPYPLAEDQTTAGVYRAQWGVARAREIIK